MTMMVDEAGIGSIGVVVALVLLSLVVLVAGLALRRRGRMRSRGVVLLWCLLVVAPLFVGFPLVFLRHQDRSIVSAPAAASEASSLTNYQ